MEQQIFLPAEAAGWRWDEKDTKYNSKTVWYMENVGDFWVNPVRKFSTL